jgi:hypothetical protein
LVTYKTLGSYNVALVETQINQHQVEDNISYTGNHTSAVGEIYITLQHSLLQFLKTRNDMSKT